MGILKNYSEDHDKETHTKDGRTKYDHSNPYLKNLVANRALSLSCGLGWDSDPFIYKYYDPHTFDMEMVNTNNGYAIYSSFSDQLSDPIPEDAIDKLVLGFDLSGVRKFEDVTETPVKWFRYFVIPEIHSVAVHCLSGTGDIVSAYDYSFADRDQVFYEDVEGSYFAAVSISGISCGIVDNPSEVWVFDTQEPFTDIMNNRKWSHVLEDFTALKATKKKITEISMFE